MHRSEKEFVDQFVVRYKETLPKIHEIYVAARAAKNPNLSDIQGKWSFIFSNVQLIVSEFQPSEVYVMFFFAPTTMSDYKFQIKKKVWYFLYKLIHETGCHYGMT